jgi:Lrp/AsnC family transcriptional regulator, regulator for asnA, asnC and gidA
MVRALLIIYIRLLYEYLLNLLYVHLRVRKLKDNGVINKFTLSLDNDLLGYDHLSFIGINITPGLADQITEELSNIEEILEVHEMHGKFDLFVKVRAKDLSHTRHIIEKKIRILPNIVDTQLMTVLKTKKGRSNSFLGQTHCRERMVNI